MANFDLSNLALQSVCPGNVLLYDDKNMPSVMVKIPKMTLADLGLGESTATHPAFIINGQEVEAIYISKYQNIVQNGRAYSLPGQDPKTGVNLDNSAKYCTDKGEGWHLMTRAEWALIALWCKQNGFLPWGNNNYGKDSRETVYKAIPTSRGSDGKVNRVATGTGPLEWSHDKSPSGIWDLNGNVSEWIGGLRTVFGEVQILANNNAADATHSQSVTSTEWMAIDATSGELITPNGTGTTPNSIKMDTVSGKLTYSVTITTQVNDYKSCIFGNVTCDATISDAAKNTLYALALLPYDSTSANYEGDYIYYNNGAEERSFYCGGNYSSGTSSGVFYASGSSPRSNSSGIIGFRSAFVELSTV